MIEVTQKMPAVPRSASASTYFELYKDERPRGITPLKTKTRTRKLDVSYNPEAVSVDLAALDTRKRSPRRTESRTRLEAQLERETAISLPPSPSPAMPVASTSKALTIDEIVAKHAPKLRGVSSPPTITTPPRQTIDDLITQHSPTLSRGSPNLSISPEASPRDSLDSIHQEARQAALAIPRPLHHARSMPAVRSRKSVSRSDSPTCESPKTDREMAVYLRSARLTRLVTLRDGTIISLADLGNPDGHPLLVCLGLGCVRYLAALYDDLAKTLGLRLICIDRWGLGRSSGIPDERRSFLLWAEVVEEVMWGTLRIDRWHVLAHSAGAPYALACALKTPTRVLGSVHLLAPWVGAGLPSNRSTSPSKLSLPIDTSARWLRFVPNGVLKTAQAAEWKLQKLRLGKPPTVPVEPVGFDHRAPASSQMLFADEDGSDEDRASQEILVTRQRRTSLLGALSPRVSPPSRATTPSLRSSRGSVHSSNSAKTVTSTTTLSPAPDLATALLRASHAESVRGGSGDLLAILRPAQSFGFAYTDVEHPIRIWHGDKDDRVSVSASKALEATMRSQVDLNIVQGADHDLLTNATVVIAALQSIAQEAKVLL